mmetsp:Transcript_26465/g.69563  ORF Transcript_26465/g.69563 Transcript_26465/m.69563 type:complete len:272 (-) Transcript_26465:73-888(-)
MPSIPTLDCSSKRCVLTKQDAIEIFQLKDEDCSHAASVIIAAKYNVSPKAIRDIWTGRSWLKATENLWNKQDLPKHNPVGRPKGKKDSRPRQMKSSVSSRKFKADLSSSGSECDGHEVCQRQQPFRSEETDCAVHLESLASILSRENSHHNLFSLASHDSSDHARSAVQLPSFSPLSQLAPCGGLGSKLLPPLCSISASSSFSSAPSSPPHDDFAPHAAHSAMLPSSTVLLALAKAWEQEASHHHEPCGLRAWEQPASLPGLSSLRASWAH